MTYKGAGNDMLTPFLNVEYKTGEHCGKLMAYSHRENNYFKLHKK